MCLAFGMPTLAFIGDVMLGRGVCEQLRWQQPEAFWGSTLPVLQSANAVIANLECAITRCENRWDRSPKVFYFRADIAAIDVLRAGNVRCVTLANNHTLDFGEEGLLETLRYLDLADIHHAGAGHNAEEAAAPAVFYAGNVRIGVISLTDNEPLFAAGEDRPGTNYVPIRTDEATMRRVQQSIDISRDMGAQFIILSPHWGPNMVLRPFPEHVDFAREVIRRGVDLVFGHSAHVFQAVERYEHGLIIYDAGDFLDDYAVDRQLRNDWSFIYLLEIDEQRMHRLRMIPVLLTYAQVDIAENRERDAICQRMISLCREFQTPLHVTPEGLEITLAAPISEAARRV